LAAFPESATLKNKLKELEQPSSFPQQSEHQGHSSSASASGARPYTSTSGGSLAQRVFGYAAPVSFAYIM
jgi:hypothetical protein